MSARARRCALIDIAVLLGVAATLIGCGEAPPPLAVRAVTFNSGTAGGGSADHPDGYTETLEGYSDSHYGNGLAFLPAVEAARAFFAEQQPDVVAFQEVFYSGDCPSVPAQAQTAFVCETWAIGDPSVANVVLGSGYQVACHLERPDKCVAVRRAFGTIRGCDSDLCLDGLDGARVPDCGRGSRVGRAVIDTADGQELTVVSIHGSSGIFADDIACRTRQFDQLFVDLGDGSDEPAANGDINLVLGDFNTDPVRGQRIDESATHLMALVERAGFAFVSEIGQDGLGTYAGGVIAIDHVLSDKLEGSCVAPGYSDDVPRIYEPPYFDHTPIVCDLSR